MLPERLNDIMEILRREGRVSVKALAQRFGVTQQTIRKDLNDLSKQRLIARRHGGAVISSGVENVGYEARRLMAGQAKQAIGHATADIIPKWARPFLSTSARPLKPSLTHSCSTKVF